MSARAQIRPVLEQLAAEIERRYGVPTDVSLLRLLRDYGLECHALGVQHAHAAPTIPVPADDDAPDHAVDDFESRYAQHQSSTRTRVAPKETG
jgi:hypothetical protein